MARGRQLILDRDCDVFSLLEPAADQIFDDLSILEPPERSIVVLGRTQTCLHLDRAHRLVGRKDLIVILSNTAEGAHNAHWHLEVLGLWSAVVEGRLLLITGGELPGGLPHMIYHSLAIDTVHLPVNQQIHQHSAPIFTQLYKPYQFLFFNARIRRHRKYLIERFDQLGLLDRALWTDLMGWGWNDDHIQLWQDGQNLMLKLRPVQYLPAEYELPDIRDRVGTHAQNYSREPQVKYDLFGGSWQDGAIFPRAYQDTYFSVVTETMFEYPETFVTEKTIKPIMMGHPWIICANPGHYRYLRNLGFRTFGHLIDESFDAIDNNQDRVERVAQSVHDLCSSDLADFLTTCQDVCYYNQQHLQEFARRERSEFLGRFFDFLKPYIT